MRSTTLPFFGAGPEVRRLPFFLQAARPRPCYVNRAALFFLLLNFQVAALGHINTGIEVKPYLMTAIFKHPRKKDREGAWLLWEWAELADQTRQ